MHLKIHFRVSNQKASKSSLQIINPKKNEIGRVIREVTKILIITLLLCPLATLSVAKTDALFTFPVLTGMPRMEHTIRVQKAAASAKKPLDVSVFSLNLSIDERILLPLSTVEMPITAATEKTAKAGGADTLARLTPDKISIIAKSFCPSCAPCIKERAQQESARKVVGTRILFLKIHKSKRAKAYDASVEITIQNVMKNILPRRKLSFPTLKLAPINEKRSAWLSLDGIFKSQAKAPTEITVSKQAQTMTVPFSSFFVSARAQTLFPTENDINAETITPKKLKTPLKNEARLSESAPAFTDE